MLFVRHLEVKLEVNFSRNSLFLYITRLQFEPAFNLRVVYVNIRVHAQVTKECFVVGSVVNIEIDLWIVPNNITIDLSAIGLRVSGELSGATYKITSCSHLGPVTCRPDLKFFWSGRLVVLL